MKRLILAFLSVCLSLLPLQAQRLSGIHLTVETNQPDSLPMRGQLLNATSNDYIRWSFLLEKDPSGAAVLTLLQAASRQSLPIALPDSLPTGSRLEFLFRFQEAGHRTYRKSASSAMERFGLPHREAVFSGLIPRLLIR